MNKKIIRILLRVMGMLITINTVACGSKTKTDNKILYSNIVSENVQKKLVAMMKDADIAEERREVLLKHINQFNAVVNPKSLINDFEEYSPDIANYDPYDMQDEWSEKSPDFMGYNCRITAFSLFREFLEIPGDGEIRDEMIIFDLQSLSEDASALINAKDEKTFSVFYSTVPTTLTKDTEVHIKALQNDWNKRGIKFLDNKKASLISVMFHEYIDENDSYLFVGHTGVLFDYNDKIYFLEKIAFQEPYQLTEFSSRSQLNNYLMGKYDVDFEQPTASPFVMENDKPLINNKAVSSEKGKNFIDAISYDMELTLDVEKKKLSEKVHIEVENKTNEAVSELCIRDMTPSILAFCEEFYSEDNQGLTSKIHSINLKDNNEPLKYKTAKDKSIISVYLGKGKEIKPGQRKSITVCMETHIPNRGDRFGYRETEKGTLHVRQGVPCLQQGR